MYFSIADVRIAGVVGVSWQVRWYAAAAAVEKEEESFAATGGF